MKKRKAKKPRVFTTKQAEQLKAANSHRRQHLCLTPKQVKELISSLRSTAGLRATERERSYFRKIIKVIEEQI